jgi:hypothetical protein
LLDCTIRRKYLAYANFETEKVLNDAATQPLTLVRASTELQSTPSLETANMKLLGILNGRLKWALREY